MVFSVFCRRTASDDEVVIGRSEQYLCPHARSVSNPKVESVSGLDAVSATLLNAPRKLSIVLELEEIVTEVSFPSDAPRKPCSQS